MTRVWNKDVEEKFQQVVAKMPVFLRPVAKKAVGEKAEKNAAEEDNAEVTEKNLIDAFFSETPFGFQGPMMTDLETVGLDYKKYGHPVDYTGGFFKK